MGRIRWRLEAVRDIERLRAFLYTKNPISSQAAAQAIYSAAKRLESSPEIGRPMADDTKRRELLIPFGASAYVMRYIFENNNVYILRIWHSREKR